MRKRRSFLKSTALLSGVPLLANGNPRELGEPKPLGVAMLGLGGYAKLWMAPAIQQSRYMKLKGIITGSPHKVPKWQEEYEIPDSGVYSYETLEEIEKNEEIDVVYIATPTGTHAEFTVRALKAGKHVIVEKPMANTVEECDLMISTAKKMGKTLQIGYRLYWDPFNVRIMSGMREKDWGGPWEELETRIGFKVNFPSARAGREVDWRLTKKYSMGGALYEVGVYAVQGAFYSSQELPVKVTAHSETRRPEIFTEVPEHWEWELVWESGRKSQHVASFGENGMHLKMKLPDGDLICQDAFAYEPGRLITPDGEEPFQQIFQQKRQIDGQALAIMNRHPVLTPAEMGRRDIYVMEKIMESAVAEEEIPLDGFKFY